MADLFNAFTGSGTIDKPVTAKEPKDSRKQNKRVDHIFTPDGANFGGSCQFCGKTMGFWFHYRTCDACLEIRPGAVTKT